MSELIYFGTAVKALGDGKFGGHLVLFTSEDDPDLEGDFFTKDTEFYVEDGQPLPVLYDHGLDKTVGRRKIGRATVKTEDVGLWLEGQLNLRDEYEKSIYALIEKGKLGLSSGAAAHLTERKALKNANQVTAWGIAEASLTPTPCEHKTQAIPLKTYIAEHDASVSEASIDEQSLLAVSALREVGLRFRGNHEARVKSGRVLSEKNRQRIRERLKEVQSVMDDLNSLLEESEPMASEAEKRAAQSHFLRLKFGRKPGASDG